MQYTSFDRLVKCRYDFQPTIEREKLLYTFIAPRDKKSFNRFISKAGEQPTFSLYAVLNSNDLVEKILQKYFQLNIELDIYIASKDMVSNPNLVELLEIFILKNNIDFNLADYVDKVESKSKK